MAEKDCNYISREPLKGWGEEKGFWRDRGPAPQVYYCSRTEELCSFDGEGCFRYSDHILNKSRLYRCPSRTLETTVEKD